MCIYVILVYDSLSSLTSYILNPTTNETHSLLSSFSNISLVPQSTNNTFKIKINNLHQNLHLRM